MKEMAMRSVNIAGFATLLVLLILRGQKASADCQSSFPAIIMQCSRFVQVSGPRIPPSPACCGAIKSVGDMACACKYVTPSVEKMISMAKVVYVARTCGLVVQAGMKCGSYTVPPVA